MKKKVWFDFVYKLKDGKLKRRFPGFKIRHWFYINIYKRKELKNFKKLKWSWFKKCGINHVIIIELINGVNPRKRKNIKKILQ